MNTYATSRVTRSLVGAGLVLMMVAAACGDADVQSTTADSSPRPSTTAAATTVPSTSSQPKSTVAKTTTSASGATSTTLDTNSLASGSGCTPGTEELPDGRWFGFVDNANEEAVVFDLACWFGGDAAILATAEDGVESPPPNDYYIRNVNTRLRTVGVASGAQVEWLFTGGGAELATISYTEWLTLGPQREVAVWPGVWLTIDDGVVTSITEQYVP